MKKREHAKIRQQSPKTLDRNDLAQVQGGNGTPPEPTAAYKALGGRVTG
jgi:hypothetical protein